MVLIRRPQNAFQAIKEAATNAAYGTHTPAQAIHQSSLYICTGMMWVFSLAGARQKFV